MDNELIQLMQNLVKKAYLSIDDIMVEEEVSKRQILYRINRLNQLLVDRSIEEIVIGNHNEFILSNKTRMAIQQLLETQDIEKSYYFSKKERLTYIYLMMFINLDYLSLNHFIDALQISRSTVLLDFKDLAVALQRYGIEIKNNRSCGYYLVGPEVEIRRYMMKEVIYSLAEEKNSRVFDLFIDKFHLDIFDYSKLVIAELAEKYNIRFVEDRLIEFIYIFIFLKARMQSGMKTDEFVGTMDYSVMQSLKEYEFTSELLKNYKKSERLSPDDVNYISSWILGISFGDINEDTKDAIIISDIVMKIMFRFGSLSGIHYQNREAIFIQLYSHIRPAYYRLLFKLPIFNPLSKKVREEYPELYHLVDEAMRPLSAIFGQDIPEEELAYLTIHFATIYSEHKVKKEEIQKTALIVCGNGIGSSAILYSELNQLFPKLNFLKPIETNEFQFVKEQYDIVFTTNYFADSIQTEVPIVKVSPVMTTREKYQVVREVYLLLGSTFTSQPNIDVVMNMIRQYSVIQNEQALHNELMSYFIQSGLGVEVLENTSLHLIDLLEEEFIQLNVTATSREDAIKISYRPLIHNHIVTEGYVEEIIKEMNRLGPYIVITKHVALPHTKPEAGAIKCGIGITVLKDPITFKSEENDPVKYIFSLSATDHETHLQAMTELVNLLGDTDFYQLLDQAESSSEIYQYIKRTTLKEQAN